MKRFAFLVLVFTVAANAEGESADKLTENEAISMCLSDTEITTTEIKAVKEQFRKIQDDSADDETVNSFEKYKIFLACILEKLDLMEDSKLVMSKVIEYVKEYRDNGNINVNMLIECLSALNDDDEMTREDRAIGVTICMKTAEEEKN